MLPLISFEFPALSIPARGAGQSPCPRFTALRGERGEILEDVAGAPKTLPGDSAPLVRSFSVFSAFKVDTSKRDGGKCLLILG